MISLFTTFFLTPNDEERQNELLLCLNKNAENEFIKNIYLLLDGKEEEKTKSFALNNVTNANKLNFINVKRIPTYGDWIKYSKWFAYELEDISVFINADIYLDAAIIQLKQYTEQVESVVCLSRHEVTPEAVIVPHPNPQWSQDLWAISKENILNITNTYFTDELDIHPTGVYRCDNKLAYIFAMRGWKIFNPFPSVKCYHVQKSPARAYGRLDTNIVGGLCFPSPTSNSTSPSELHISVMPVKVGRITKCAINTYLQKNLFPELEQIKSVNLMQDFKPAYIWPSKAFPFREYFTSADLKIFIIENIIHNYEWLKQYKDKITEKHFFFVTLCWNHNEFLCEQTNKIFELLKLHKNNFFFMCNSSQELACLNKFGFKGELINHNAWLDENLYRIQPIEKIYNALLIARRAVFKRHYLAGKISNLALIAGGARHNHTEEIILPPHCYNNETPLKLEQIIEKINQSYVGLSLSKEEGACYSSSEYLLCGIPVVSTISEGGRDFWYDDYNSIICEDSEESVASSVEIFLKNRRDPEIIRSNHIALAKQQRTKFIKALQEVFVKNNIDIDAKAYFKDNFINKLKKSCAPNFNKIF